MSTPDVRAALLAQVATLVSPVPVFNLSDYVGIDDLPLTGVDMCVLVDFVASSERIATIGDTDSLGFEETGTVAIHWLAPTGFASAPTLTQAEALRRALRGRRFGDIIIESVDPFADAGSPVDREGRWTGFSSLLFYSLHSCG